MTRLYAYRETCDTGFAPNPFHGVLTLANCKPRIRCKAQVGDWVAAFTANNVSDGRKIIYRGKKGEEKVIWIGCITKKLTFAEYWEQYQQKRPKMLKYTVIGSKSGGCGAKVVVTSSGCGAKQVVASVGCGMKSTDTNMSDDFFGDNIYMPDENAPLGFRQIQNNFHEEWQMGTDLGGKFVLICEKFYYFGAANPYELQTKAIIPNCRGHRVYNADDEASRKFIEEFKQFTVGIQK